MINANIIQVCGSREKKVNRRNELVKNVGTKFSFQRILSNDDHLADLVDYFRFCFIGDNNRHFVVV